MSAVRAKMGSEVKAGKTDRASLVPGKTSFACVKRWVAYNLKQVPLALLQTAGSP